MTETIALNISAEVAAGPSLKVRRTLALEAYDKLTVEVPDGTEGLEVELQPASDGGVQLLIVQSDRYGNALTYSAGGGDAHPLDQPLVLAGSGAVALLGGGPKKLKFENKLGPGMNATVQILIGRDATPTPSSPTPP